MRSKVALAGALAGTILICAIAIGTIATLAGGLNPKELFAQNITQQRTAAAAAAQARKKTDKPLPAPTSEKAVRLTGIQNVQQGPVPSSQFLVNNQWSAPRSTGSEQWWQVYAGAKGQGEGQPGIPAVYVETSTPSADGYSFQGAFVGIFTAPQADSSLTIMGVTGNIIDLQTKSGRTYQFNLITEQYQ